MDPRWSAKLFERRVRERPLPGFAAWLRRPFSRTSTHRVLIYYTSSAICRSQVAPFLTYSKEFAATYGADVRLIEIDTIGSTSDALLRSATHVLIQPWFTIASERLQAVVDLIGARAPQAALSFLDSFAPNDLRFAATLPDDLAFYIKKSLFADEHQYQRIWHGDTNLVDYYSDLYGIEADPVDFTPPNGFETKLRLGPNFFTAPHLMAGFTNPSPPPQDGREIDVQTRLGRKGSPWYSAMRDAALASVESLEDVSISAAGRVTYPEYMKEMQKSRLCFSPFGYGELCWRDIEAFMTGAVLVKPDMSHLKTLPDLYEPWVTYVPVQWDYSDVGPAVANILSDQDARSRIANEAYRRVKTYIDDAQFVTDMAFLFEDT